MIIFLSSNSPWFPLQYKHENYNSWTYQFRICFACHFHRRIDCLPTERIAGLGIRHFRTAGVWHHHYSLLRKMSMQNALCPRTPRAARQPYRSRSRTVHGVGNHPSAGIADYPDSAAQFMVVAFSILDTGLLAGSPRRRFPDSEICLQALRESSLSPESISSVRYVHRHSLAKALRWHAAGSGFCFWGSLYHGKGHAGRIVEQADFRPGTNIKRFFHDQAA